MLIDVTLLNIITWIIQLTFQFSDTVDYWLFFGLYYTYSTLMETSYQQTIGKMILRIKVIKTDGTNPELLSSFYRNLGKLISTLPLFYGFLRILAPHQRQTIHDELAKCWVIENRL
jgi:uncharacterized RDD family membrane protein YckC